MGMGRTLIVLGVALVVIGTLISLGGRLPFRLGHLPGDIEIRGRNTAFYFPLVTCLILSAVLSLVIWLFGKR
jgi:hypothetical protein